MKQSTSGATDLGRDGVTAIDRCALPTDSGWGRQQSVASGAGVAGFPVLHSLGAPPVPQSPHGTAHVSAAGSHQNAPSRDDRYRLTYLRTLLHRSTKLLPPAWREAVAERLLRRRGAPGPAAEHVVQYLLSAAKAAHGSHKRLEATVAKGADYFYERQYRQYLNATMGAFAATATQALVASGGAPQGHWWRRHRRTYAAMVDQNGGAPPLVVVNGETVAVALLLPKPRREGELKMVGRWLTGRGPMPGFYQRLVTGEVIRCSEPTVHARERSADGAILEVVDAAVQSKRLALLALHPHDPDAMGLHITLFGIDILGPDQLEREYGLGSVALSEHRDAARRTDRLLAFCVGGTEEVFTQCSQNLFVKRPVMDSSRPVRPVAPNAWDARLPLDRLFGTQFETIQVTVSASGLPGASPRNGDLGKAAFVGRHDHRVFLVVPYHPGNAVHGHAAKVWSNPYGTLVVSDDHHAFTRITFSGPARVLDHARVTREFPSIVAQVAAQRGHDGKALPEPEYWFLQEVKELVQQREPLAASTLDPGRPTCSISAGGQAHHGKKPHYFAADTLPLYDQTAQHRREAAGRPVDPTGAQRRRWLETVQYALEARQTHLWRALNGAEHEEENA